MIVGCGKNLQRDNLPEIKKQAGLFAINCDWSHVFFFESRNGKELAARTVCKVKCTLFKQGSLGPSTIGRLVYCV